MLVIKTCKGQTIVIFASGKLRVMGSHVTTRKEAKCVFKKILRELVPTVNLYLAKVHVQTITATFDIGHTVNLYKLHLSVHKHYDYGKDYYHPGYTNLLEPELFPALQLKIWGMARHINIFATGKCVFTGLRDYDEACDIANDIVNFVDGCT